MADASLRSFARFPKADELGGRRSLARAGLCARGADRREHQQQEQAADGSNHHGWTIAPHIASEQARRLTVVP
jgi:hypothetical protein